jgi:hypothetical protein
LSTSTPALSQGNLRRAGPGGPRSTYRPSPPLWLNGSSQAKSSSSKRSSQVLRRTAGLHALRFLCLDGPGRSFRLVHRGTALGRQAGREPGPPSMTLQRTRRPRVRSGRSLRSLGSPLNARPLDVGARITDATSRRKARPLATRSLASSEPARIGGLSRERPARTLVPRSSPLPSARSAAKGSTRTEEMRSARSRRAPRSPRLQPR